MAAPARAVFIDRDGTVNREISTYVRTPEQLEVFPHAAEALRPLSLRGIPIFIASNQAGVGKGLMSDADLQAIERKLRGILREGGVEIAGGYYCRHTDDMNCECRKPKGGLLRIAAADHGLDLAKSFMVGDSWRDMAAGKSAGVRTVFVPTGIDPEQQRARLDSRADYEAADLFDAVRWICEQLDEEDR